VVLRAFSPPTKITAAAGDTTPQHTHTQNIRKDGGSRCNTLIKAFLFDATKPVKPPVVENYCITSRHASEIDKTVTRHSVANKALIFYYHGLPIDSSHNNEEPLQDGTMVLSGILDPGLFTSVTRLHPDGTTQGDHGRNCIDTTPRALRP
jgi:hypothetical protein